MVKKIEELSKHAGRVTTVGKLWFQAQKNAEKFRKKIPKMDSTEVLGQHAWRMTTVGKLWFWVQKIGKNLEKLPKIVTKLWHAQ